LPLPDSPKRSADSGRSKLELPVVDLQGQPHEVIEEQLITVHYEVVKGKKKEYKQYSYTAMIMRSK
jgi:hypothetical protein